MATTTRQPLDKRHRLALAREHLMDYRMRLRDYLRLADAAGNAEWRDRVATVFQRCDVTIAFISDRILSLTQPGDRDQYVQPPEPAEKLGPWAMAQIYPHRWRLVFTLSNGRGCYAVDEQGGRWATFNGGSPVPCALCRGTPHLITRGWCLSPLDGAPTFICSMHVETRPCATPPMRLCIACKAPMRAEDGDHVMCRVCQFTM